MTNKELLEQLKNYPDEAKIKILGQSGIEWILDTITIKEESGKPEIIKIKLR